MLMADCSVYETPEQEDIISLPGTDEMATCLE